MTRRPLTALQVMKKLTTAKLKAEVEASRPEPNCKPIYRVKAKSVREVRA